MFAMTGLESITQKILDDAKAKAKSITDNAEKTAAEIIMQANNDINIKKGVVLEEARENAVLRSDRIIAATQLEGKKQLLAAKQELIDTVFSRAAAQLASLDDSEYDALIKNMSEKVSGEITPLPRYREKGTGGGFIAKNGKVLYNFSFEALAKNAKEKLEAEIVSILFG